MKRKICSFLLAFLLLLTLTPAALADGAQPSYITDDAGILTASETASLEKAAQHIAQRYGVGIYLVTVNDACRIDSRGTYEAAYTYYHRNSLGAGAERNGAILLLSMNDRAFAHFYYGEKSEYAFNRYAQEQIEDTFLDNFRENDWYGGFSDYLSACGEYLALAAEGHPVRRSPVPAIVISCAAASRADIFNRTFIAFSPKFPYTFYTLVKKRLLKEALCACRNRKRSNVPLLRKRAPCSEKRSASPPYPYCRSSSSL